MTRAAKALGCMFTLAKSNSRITAVFVYQFNPAAGPRDRHVRRRADQPGRLDAPGYAVVKSRKARSCHK